MDIVKAESLSHSCICALASFSNGFQRQDWMFAVLFDPDGLFPCNSS
jgi:hypothetical protein